MSNQYNYPIPRQGLDYIEPTYCNPFPNGPYPNPEGIDWTKIDPKPQEKTFFEFAQTFWLNTINVRNRQFITDGKTGGYPTLQSIFWRYIESGTAVNIPNNNFTYQTMIEYVNGLGDYWMKFISQMIPCYKAELGWKTQYFIDKNLYGEDKEDVNWFQYLVILVN